MSETTRPNYRPKLGIYHANPRGTGSALQLELVPAGNMEGNAPGYFGLTIAQQKTVAQPGTPPSFDWTSAITTRLYFDDLTAFQQVFRGETENVNEGKGIWHRSEKFNTIIRLEHVLDPVCGYILTVLRKPVDAPQDEQPEKRQILLSSAEALGLSMTIDSSFYLVTFGLPRVFFPTQKKD